MRIGVTSGSSFGSYRGQEEAREPDHPVVVNDEHPLDHGAIEI
jgi:hypothetical protein